MGKMSELFAAVSELKNAAKSLVDAADALTDLFSGSGDIQSESQTGVKTQAPKKEHLTLETVRATLAEKSRNGYTAEIRALLEKHGASRLSEIDPSKYSALLDDAEVLGNE